jgi:DNA adenine methylase
VVVLFFFHLLPERALLSDIDEELIETYRAVKCMPREVIAGLRRLTVSSEEFYKMRDYRPRTRLNRAVRLLYLNRTAFGGIYRLNSLGQFNVPYGGERTPADLHESDILLKAAGAMRRARVRHIDFEAAISDVKAGDVVYCDPTYTVTHDNNSSGITNATFPGPTRSGSLESRISPLGRAPQ